MDCCFCCAKRRFFCVQNPPLLAVGVGYSIVNPHVTQIQRILNDLVSICTFRAVGVMNVYVTCIYAFARNTFHSEVTSEYSRPIFRAQIKRRVK